MSWQAQDVEHQFDEMLRAVEQDGPQQITRNGEEVAVVLRIAEYRAMVARNEEAP